MSQNLPTGGFRWITAKKKIELERVAENIGLILEVDLEYPKELHDLHNGYPLAPEKMTITEDMLSEYCNKIKDKFNLTVGNVQKLVMTLSGKKNYVVHYKNLILYKKLGLKVTKVHRVLRFNQSPWLREYINFNTEMRKNSKNDFEKNFFKLMNNSVFGKTMENLRKRVDVQLVSSEKKLLRMASRPTFVSTKIFNESLAAVRKIKGNLVLNKPAYVGMCILDLSKTLMYDFHYNYIKKRYNDRATLLFTDTDSLMYEIQTEDVYKDFIEDREMFDNSDYTKNSQFYFAENKKVIGKMKDEAVGVPITEFVGLRSKMYSYIKEDGKGGKTAKGVKKSVIKLTIEHNNYRDVLTGSSQLHHKMHTIRSVGHNIGTYEINKISLSCFDDKRHILPDGVKSLAYGHHEATEDLE